MAVKKYGYDKDTDYKALMDDAASRGDYKSAAGYEQQRNAKIAGEGLSYQQTNDYAGWLDETDYSDILRQQMSAGASSKDVADTLAKRVQKASTTEGMQKYAYDDTFNAALKYIQGQQGGSSATTPGAPSASKYQAQIDELTAQIFGRAPFEYNHLEDPAYHQLAESYTREGEKAMRDTLAEVSARTGGLASSYAGTVAQQTYDGYMSALADRIPELRQLAYEMYMDEGNALRADLETLLGLDDREYNRGLAERDWQYMLARDRLADQRYADELAYSRGRDEISDARYADELAYNRGQDAREWEYTLGRDEIADARYEDETARAREQALREWEYMLGRDAVDDARYEDETAYNREQNEREWQYQLGRDAVADGRYAEELAYQRGRDEIADARYADETAYEREQDAYEREVALAKALAESGDYSAYAALLGLTDEQMQELVAEGADESAVTVANNHRTNGDGEITLVHIPGLGWRSPSQVDALVESGAVEVKRSEDGTIYFANVKG